MKKNTMYLIIGILIVAGVFLAKKEATFGTSIHNDYANCEQHRQSIIAAVPTWCVTECELITPAIEACIDNNPLYSVGSLPAGKYTYMRTDLQCSEITNDDGMGDWYDCVYGTSTPGTCNTAADSNCDGKVADSELITYMSEWKAEHRTTNCDSTSGCVSDQKLLASMSAWKNTHRLA